MKSYDKIVGRITPEEVKDEEPPEESPNLKEQWEEEPQTQKYIEYLSKRRQELLDTVSAIAYSSGNISSKNLSQLIEAEVLKLSIQNYLEK